MAGGGTFHPPVRIQIEDNIYNERDQSIFFSICVTMSGRIHPTSLRNNRGEMGLPLCSLLMVFGTPLLVITVAGQSTVDVDLDRK